MKYIIVLTLVSASLSLLAQSRPNYQAEYDEYKRNTRIISGALNSCVSRAKTNVSRFYENNGDSVLGIPVFDDIVMLFNNDDYEQLIADHNRIKNYSPLPRTVGTSRDLIGRRLGDAARRQRIFDQTLSNCQAVLSTMGIHDVYRTPGVSNAQRDHNIEVTRRNRRRGSGRRRSRTRGH